MQQAANRKRRWLMVIPSLALVIGIGAISSPSALRAQSSPGDSLQGTWIETVSPPGRPGFLDLHTHTAGGEVVEETNNTVVRGEGHGQWVKTGDRQFTLTVVFFRFDGATTRKFIGMRRVTEQIELDSPDTYHALVTPQDFDVNGNPDGSPEAAPVPTVGKRVSMSGSLQ
jgi:hypothetical protein